MPLKHRGAVSWAKWTLTVKVFLFSVSLWDSAWISFVNYMVWQECDLLHNEMSIMQEGGKGLFKCVKCHTWTPSGWLRINTFNNSPHSLAVSLPTASLQWPHQSRREYTLCLHGRSFPSEPNARHEPLWTYYFPVPLESSFPSARHSAEGTVQHGNKEGDYSAKGEVSPGQRSRASGAWWGTGKGVEQRAKPVRDSFVSHGKLS